MKQYVIDQLREEDYEHIRDFLEKNGEKTVFDEIYWIDLPKDLYSSSQLEHAGCHTFYFAVNLTRNRVSFELLIRSRQTMRCSCIGYATKEQRDYIIEYADTILSRLGIKL